MEYLEHGDLQSYLSDKLRLRLPEQDAGIITSQILVGLSYMHESGFIHRDLKPAVSV